MYTSAELTNPDCAHLKVFGFLLDRLAHGVTSNVAPLVLVCWNDGEHSRQNVPAKTSTVDRNPAFHSFQPAGLVHYVDGGTR
jgi:hypothetical protein